MALTIDQISQVAQSIKYILESSPPNTFKLEDQIGKGLFPDMSEMYLSIFDKNGTMVSSSLWRSPADLANPRKTVNVADRDHFVAVRDNPESPLIITRPTVGRLSGLSVIRFSKRLNAPDGSFAGELAVAVSPDYLARYFDPMSVRTRDFLSLRMLDGQMMVTKSNGKVRVTPTVFRSPPALDGNGIAVDYPGRLFLDNEPHILAAARVGKYPLIAVAGSRTSEVLAEYERAARVKERDAVALTMLLALVAAGGTRIASKTARRRALGEATRQAYLQAIEGSDDGYYSVRAIHGKGEGTHDDAIIDFVMEECNERGARMMGTTRANVLGMKVSTFFSDASRKKVLAIFLQAMERGSYDDELHIPATKTGQEQWVSRRMVRTMNGLAVTVRDISESKRHSVEVDTLTYTDLLTSLPNRNWLSHHMPLAIESAQKEGRKIAILYLDVDDFRAVNNTVGHAGGDTVLNTLARRLKNLMRPVDQVVRMGADEFAILTELETDLEGTSMIAGQIMHAFAEPILLNDGSKQIVAASIGISIYPQDGLNGDDLIRNANIAMDAAKQAGKARYQYYERHLSERLTFRRNIEADLRNAIANDEFVLHYQPRVDALTGEIRSMEALLRWVHPTRGMVPPLDFIALAEETGQIVPIGAIVIRKVCEQIAQWKVQGLEPVPVSLNVSPRQFSHGNLHTLLESAMRCLDVAAAFVEVEITESCMLGEDKAVAAELASIKGLGVKLLVDDFGTGYSSLSQLQRLDLDVLKVDRSFTSNLVKSTEGEIFFKAIISMAHSLGMSVVAEGVETIDQLRILQRLECNEIQGYFISKPVSAETMGALLIKRHLMPATVVS